MIYIKGFKLFESKKEYDFEIKSKSWGNLSNKELKEYFNFLKNEFEIDNDYIENSDIWVYLSYKENGKLKALCDMGFYPPDEFHNKEHIFINYIYTETKRKGIGESMIRYLLNSYNEYDFVCFVKQSNIPSLKMFQKLGFKIKKDNYKFDDEKELYCILKKERS